MVACGSEPVAVSPAGSPSADPAGPSPADERARLLATCPAEAPSWTDVDGPVGDDPGLAERQAALSRAADVAQAYLSGLPADMTGAVRLDHHRRAIVVQVTRDGDRVREELQPRLADGVTAVVETVRYSTAELTRAAATIRGLKDLEWSTIATGGADGRVEVTVPGDVEAARAAITAVVDPCMVRVRHGGRPVPLAPRA
jgi:hypothetical protein